MARADWQRMYRDRQLASRNRGLPSVSPFADFGHPEVTADLASELVRNLRVTRNGAAAPGSRVRPPGMPAALSNLEAMMFSQVLDERRALHSAMVSSL